MRRMAIAATAALLLAGCGTESASFLVSGGDVALTLERTKPYFWSDGWDLEMVVRNNPACQRRYPLKGAADGAFKVEVYSAGPGVFILRQAKRWYVTDLKSCQFQQFKETPPEPGALLGAFQTKNGDFKFVIAKGEGAAAPAEAGKAD